MIRQLITTSALITFSGILPVSAYSGIADVNGYSVDQLKEAGITIKPWENDEGRDDPAMRWVEISYDWKKMGKDRHVEMTLFTGQQDLKTASLCRAEHRKGHTDPMKLLFAIPRENIGNCYVWILFPEDKDKETAPPKEFGLGDGPQGYSLDAWRIIQLAGGVPEGKPEAMNEILPDADGVKSVSIKFDGSEPKDVGFEATAEDWAAIRSHLLPAEEDPEPAKWEWLGTVKLVKNDGQPFVVELYQTGEARGAFAVEAANDQRRYFRGGEAQGPMKALLSAFEKSKKADAPDAPKD